MLISSISIVTLLLLIILFYKKYYKLLCLMIYIIGLYFLIYDIIVNDISSIDLITDHFIEKIFIIFGILSIILSKFIHNAYIIYFSFVFYLNFLHTMFNDYSSGLLYGFSLFFLFTCFIVCFILTIVYLSKNKINIIFYLMILYTVFYNLNKEFL